MICTGCGHANTAGARFCEQCGSPLERHCESCGNTLSPTARFCSSCGAPAGTDPAPGPAEGTLKVVSVVFSDLVGSTALQETLDNETVRRVMARYYAAMRAVADRHQGQIQKFIGDAVVVVFGVPVVLEDDALRAVRCAAEMVSALESLSEELGQLHGVRLAIRTGVNTGELVVNREGIFVGDTMNTAARLEQAAAPGEVLLGEATWRLVRHRAELTEVSPLELKGKSRPVRAWRLISTTAEPPDEGPTGSIDAPLIGRERELARLREALETAVADRACRLVTLIGSPGLGKSRLAHEFAISLGTTARILEGRCEPSGEGITFLPVADVLRDAAEIGEADSPEVVRDKLAGILGDDPEATLVVRRAAAVLGAGEPASPEETFWGLRRVLESLARRDVPLVVLLDDVHWGQPMFLDLIEHLVEWVRDAPILLVALARPELREQRAALASTGRRAADVIELGPLAPEHSRELVYGLLGALDVVPELLDRILATTDGNPLFLSELLRMLVDEGALVPSPDGEGWVAAGGAEAVQVPPTIQALLTARIERLQADERVVVQRAAVIGKQFYRGAVAELAPPPVSAELDGHLERLRRKELVEPEGTYWIDEPVYRFHHVLIRDAAYHLLLKEARAELHERFADWLEGKAGELVGEHEEVIAYHLEQAHEYRRQLGPLDERGRSLGHRAASHLAAAGRRALAREDLAAAANLLTRALDRDASAEEAEVLWDLLDALLSAGETAQAAASLARLQPLAPDRARVLSGQLAVLIGEQALDRVLAEVKAAVEALAQAGDGVAAAKGHHVLAQVQAQLGQVADVEASLDRALLAARRTEDRRRITSVLAAAPRAALWGPSPVVRASGRCLDVVRILRMSPGNRHVEAVALRCQAVLEAMRGRAEAAREILSAGRATLQELGLTLELHELGTHAGIVELLAGEPEAARDLLSEARCGFASLGVSVAAAHAAALLGRALVELGRDAEAIAETEFAESRAGGDLKTTIAWLGVRAEALARRGELEDALTLARRAVELADPTDALADKADAQMSLARVLRNAGRAEEARAAADAAEALYRAKDHVVGMARARELASRSAALVRAPSEISDGAILDPGLEALLARYSELLRARDLEGLIALHAADWVGHDHRNPDHGEHHEIEPAVRSVLAASSGTDLELDGVLASAPGVIALWARWHRGVAAAPGGLGVRIGYVAMVREGLLAREEIFEPEAESAMRAAFAEKVGLTLLGAGPAERWLARWVECFGRHDEEAIAELWSPDVEFVDRNSLAWEHLAGREAMVALSKSAWAMSSDIRCAIDEVLACDERTIATRWTFHATASDGGGAVEISRGTVSVVEDGLCVRREQFDPDDREGMLARYRELGGVLPPRGARHAQRAFERIQRLLNARDYPAFAELVADDWCWRDHRPLGWDSARGRDACLEIMRSTYDASPGVRLDVDEVLACDDRVIALRLAWRGRGRKAGELEVTAGQVLEFSQDGLWVSAENFDAEDRRAMIARYAELGGGLSSLGETPPERWVASWAAAYAAADFDGLQALVCPECRFEDHRRLGWDAMRTSGEWRELARSIWAAASDVRLEVDEVLAGDERVMAFQMTLHATTRRYDIPSQTPVGAVIVIEEERLLSWDQYDPGDADAVLARYRELGGRTAAVSGGSEVERFFQEFFERLRARDYERLGPMIAEDWFWRDHRALGWEDAHGRDACLRTMRSLADTAPGVRVEFDEVLACDGRVIAVIQAWRGHGIRAGELEVTAGAVHVVENGRWVSADFYPPEDRIAIIGRYAELGGGTAPLGDSPIEDQLRRYAKHYAARDLEAITAEMAADWVHVDHRLVGWPQSDVTRYREDQRVVWDSCLDVRAEVDEVMACDGRVLAGVMTYRGTAQATGGGRFEYCVGFTWVVEDGLGRRLDWYDPEDRAGILAGFRERQRSAMLAPNAELGDGAQPSVLGDSPVERSGGLRRRAVRFRRGPGL